jgi:hypothetical protein
MPVWACFVATRARGTASSSRHHIPDGQGGRVTAAGLDQAARRFLAVLLKGCQHAPLAEDLDSAMKPARSTSIVGLLLIRLRQGPGVQLELEDFDPESRLWHDLEGRATQRVVFDVAHSLPMDGLIEAVPVADVGQAKRPASQVQVSEATRERCRAQVDPALAAWRREGIAVEAPSFVMTFPPAIAHALSHGALKRFEMSAFRKLGHGVELAQAFLACRAKCSQQLDRLLDPSDASALEPKMFASLAVTLQGWLEFLGRGAPDHHVRQELYQECNMWSVWSAAVARKLSPQRSSACWTTGLRSRRASTRMSDKATALFKAVVTRVCSPSKR